LTCAIIGNAVRWLRTVGQLTIRDKVVIEGLGQQGLAATIVAKEFGVDLARKRGTIVAPGMCGAETEVLLLADNLVRKEISLKGVYSHDARAVKQAIKIVESRKYPLENLVTHVFSLEETNKAVQVAGGEIPGEYPIKTVLVP